jgi:hypothetical protein
MFRSIMGIVYLALSFMGFVVSVYTLHLLEYASVMAVGIWSVALASAAIGCWLIITGRK